MTFTEQWLLLVGFCLLSALIGVGIGCLIGEGRGVRKTDASWELEWEKRKQQLTPSPWVGHGSSPSVLRVAHRPEPPAVVEPVRTEVLPGYRARHSSSEVTGPIEREGEFTQEIKRMTAEYYSQAAAHMRAVAR